MSLRDTNSEKSMPVRHELVDPCLTQPRALGFISSLTFCGCGQLWSSQSVCLSEAFGCYSKQPDPNWESNLRGRTPEQPLSNARNAQLSLEYQDSNSVTVFPRSKAQNYLCSLSESLAERFAAMVPGFSRCDLEQLKRAALIIRVYHENTMARLRVEAISTTIVLWILQCLAIFYHIAQLILPQGSKTVGLGGSHSVRGYKTVCRSSCKWLECINYVCQ